MIILRKLSKYRLETFFRENTFSEVYKGLDIAIKYTEDPKLFKQDLADERPFAYSAQEPQI